jgi:leucyl/phenylalanyl-tRNA---protein transferase
VPKNLRRFQRRTEMDVRFDQDFENIIHSCQEGRTGWIWITPALIEVYREVHRLGFVSTVGTYRDGRLVGGLWGIGIGRVFGVMSMFHREDQAGSLAVAALVDAVLSEDRWSVIDFGVLTPNFQMYGAREISAEHFRELIWSNLKC